MRLLVRHAAVQRRARIRRQDVEGRGLDALLDRPLHRALEHRPVVAVHAEDEAAVDHHAEVVQAADGGGVVAPQVLVLALLGEVGRVQRLEADEQAAQPGFDGLLEQTGREHRVDRAGRLPQAAHAAHARRTAPWRSGDRRTGDRRGSRDGGRAGGRSRRARRRRSACRRIARPRRTPPCSRSRRRAGSRARRRSSSGPDRAGA